MSLTDEPTVTVENSNSVKRRLVGSSALMLFLELALIRWTGSNVVHLAYFSNFVLLGSFLGIGVGFLRASRNPGKPILSLMILALLVGLVLKYPVTINRSGSDLIYFTAVSIEGPPAWTVLPVIFLAVATILMGPAQIVGECFERLSRLDAYRWDLVGSLLGIGAFTALSFLYAPPVVWGVIAAGLYLWLLAPDNLIERLLVITPALALVALLAGESIAAQTLWSPYSKITWTSGMWDGHPGTQITANGVPHQSVSDANYRLQESPFYGYPYARTPANPHKDVLIVGAGSGTDAAIALRNGATRVDAVEIDPRLKGIGVQRNPDKPYGDPRVHAHINDGRAFLSSTDRKYDLIIFALPDSLTLVPGQGALRLESYLFTREAFASARDHLKPGGAFSMYNFYRERWLVDRLAGTADKVFGHAPCLDVPSAAGQLAVMTAGLTQADQACQSVWTDESFVEPTTDDRPFLYLKDASIPSLHLIVLALILAASVIVVRLFGGPFRKMRPYGDLVLLGAAFMLLETKSVTGFALLFGTTWVVNAIVFGGVLVAVLAAVEVTRRFRTPPLPVMFGILLAGLVLAWVVPNSWLLELPLPVRAVAAVTIAFLPIFAANIIFARRFTETADASTAFGANLLGAMVGGCLEYIGLATGYHFLLIVAAVLYLAAFAVMRRTALA
ncbi:spermidine synthase [Actinocorallia longicatena]|uniref:Spermine/spermidine synthase n=1 Tax=Actinocorallia longicatena TaxID=111803 RepID=A0ABP6QHN9_9ACTN